MYLRAFFQNMSAPTSVPVRSLHSLTALRFYLIVEIEENAQGIMFVKLQGSEEEGQFESFFNLPPSAKTLLWDAVSRNAHYNGPDSPLYLVFTGEKPYGLPMLKVFGEGFTQRLG